MQIITKVPLDSTSIMVHRQRLANRGNPCERWPRVCDDRRIRSGIRKNSGSLAWRLKTEFLRIPLRASANRGVRSLDIRTLKL
jgi:hypothetical protein